ncbi:MAG TPA: DNA polymerase III subunit alpha [Puia sp.]|nr:DNA polymerase III subunit alpha [Puia sp.]
MPTFSHLHVHTQFSLLDGAASIPSLYQKALTDNMPALAITDHGNMFGAFEFVAEAHKYKNEDGSLKIKPIVGCEFYVVADRHRKIFTKDQKDNRYHQIFLAKNQVGYQNLIKLTSLGFIEGLYSKYPRIDKELIEKYHEGLIATTCCMGASVPQSILNQSEEKAETEFRWWLELFGEDYYVELQRHDIREQEKINQLLLKFAIKYHVPIIATNDSHYTDKEDYNAHDILLCVNTGEKQSTPGYDDYVNDDMHVKNRRFKFPNNNFYFKTTSEMSSLFSDLPEAIDNTSIIVDKVEVLNLKKDILLPAFPVPSEFQIHGDDRLNQWEFLKHITYLGAKNRYDPLSVEIQERIDFELFTIKTMGFAGYFLIVSDFIRAGREMNVLIGPGRGSAAGSVVAYCIGITNIDPIKYNLLFERFLNPDRKTMPDIDTDFDDEGRQKVIEYVVKKYGANQVAQIVTYGTMAAKSSIKDVARVMDLPLAESNALAKLVPEKIGVTLKRVLHAPLIAKDGDKSLEEKEGLNPDDLDLVKKIRSIYGTQGDLRSKVLHEAERLEGSVRNTGLHAAGIIIAPENLFNIIPVCKVKDSDLLVTQIEGSIIEDAGVLKMDFLGLRTLNILKTTIELIKENYALAIDIDAIPLNDRKTFELYQKAETIGTFQFESPGMQKYLRDLKPDKFDDLIAMNALYRPGPIAYIPNYIDRKHGREAITFDLPEMEEYLRDTYGITVYQEQVMLLAQKLAGFTKGEADVLRKAMGKKDRKTLDKMKGAFLRGAAQKKHDQVKLEKIWTDWEAFAQYAFNKSHSTCYAYVAYQTAYLKVHYPGEYMAAVLNHSGSIEKITFFMEECKRMGLKVLGPDINESQKGFANHGREIRVGLGGLKGVGEAAVETIIFERKQNGAYSSIFDLVKRVNQRAVNKKTLESLAYAGAFDSFKELHRAQFFFVPPGDTSTGLEKVIKFGNVYQSNANQNNNSLFGELTMPEISTPRIPNCEPWTLTEQLDHEKEITGMFMSGHPLDHFKFEISHYGIVQLSEFNEIKDSAGLQSHPAKSYRIAGLVVDAQHRISKAGKQFGSFVIEDYSGKSEFMIWSEDYARYANYLEKGKNLFLTGTFRQRFNKVEFEFKIEKIMLLESVKQQLTKQIVVDIEARFLNEEKIRFFERNLKRFPGRSILKFNISEIKNNFRISMLTGNAAFEMNDEMAAFFAESPEMDIQVVTM